MPSSEEVEKRIVQEVASQLGYGHLMSLASSLWREKLKKDNLEGGEFTVGPCTSQTVPCQCKQPAQCDWCCGSQWLTKKVKEIKEQIESKKKYQYISLSK